MRRLQIRQASIRSLVSSGTGRKRIKKTRPDNEAATTVQRVRTKNSIGESSTETEQTSSTSLSHSNRTQPQPQRKCSSRRSNRAPEAQQQPLQQSQPRQRPPLEGGRREASSRTLMKQKSRRSDLIASMWSSHTELPLNKPNEACRRSQQKPPSRRTHYTKSNSVPALLAPKPAATRTYRTRAAQSQRAPKMPGTTYKANNDADGNLQQKVRHIESSQEINLKKTGSRSRYADADCGNYYKIEQQQNDNSMKASRNEVPSQRRLMVDSSEKTALTTMMIDNSEKALAAKEEQQPPLLTTKAQQPSSPLEMVIEASPMDMVVEVPADFDGDAV